MGPRLSLKQVFARPLAWVIVAFVVSRAIAFALGVRFDATPPLHVWHVVDLEPLRTRLWESIYHLHGQPPLFNLFLGLGQQAFGAAAPWFFHAAYLGLGLVLSLALYGAMAALGVERRLAAGLAIAFAVSPSALLYENWLLYTYPLAALMAAAALALTALARRPGFWPSLLFFGLLAAICLIRPLYHLVWIFAALGLVLTPFWGDRVVRRRILLGAALPIALVVGLYAKNAIVFGSFSGSTWLGMNLARISLAELSPQRKAMLVESGDLSTLALHSQFQPLSAYPAALVAVAPTGVAVLDRPLKANGEPNFNHLAYLGLSKLYMKESLAAMRHAPESYLKGVARAHLYYFRSSSDYGLVEGNRRKIGAWDALYNKAFYGCLTMREQTWLRAELPLTASAEARIWHEMENTAWFLVVALPLLGVLGLRAAWKGWKAGELPLALTLAFVCMTVAYATGLGNFLDVGENNRFRFDVDPLYLLLLGVALQGLRRRFEPA